ncbi:MAG: biotin/lipoyl-containing protein, partial [Qipengyuania sp.]
MCIYGMEGPGGYQLFGRTIQVWNTYRQTDVFKDGKPWLLRFFDQIRFFEVSAEELEEWRRDFPAGRRSIEVEHSEFRLADYRAFLSENAQSIAAFEETRQAAFDAERGEWERNGEFDRLSELADDIGGAVLDAPAVDVPEGAEVVESPFGGYIWKLLVAEGDEVEKGDTVAVIEAMKMECPLESPAAGTISSLYIEERQPIEPGAPLMALTRRG